MSAASQSKSGTIQRPGAQPTTIPVNRLWFVLTGAAVLITAVGLILYLTLALNWHNRPFFGALLSSTLHVNAGRPTSSEVWPGLQAGLQPHDHILAVSAFDSLGQVVMGRQLLADSPTDYAAARRSYNAILAKLEVGTTIEVEFSRPAVDGRVDTAGEVLCSDPIVNNAAQCKVRYRLERFPDGDFLSYFVIPYASGLVVFVIGLVVLRIRHDQPSAFLATLICSLLAFLMIGIFDVGSTYALIPLWLVSGILLGGALATLGLIFPVEMLTLYKRPALRYLPTVVSLILAAVVLYRYSLDIPEYHFENYQVNALVALIGMTMLFFSLIYQRQRATTPLIRDQSNAILIGIGLVLVPAAVWLASRILQVLGVSATLPLSIESSMPFFITPAASIAYAVLQIRRWDTDKVISRGIAYTIMLGVLIVGYFLLVLGATLLARDTVAANHPLSIALTIFLISVLFLPVRVRLQQRIERIYFRIRRNYQERVEGFARKSTSLIGYSQIVDEFKRLLENTVSPLNTFIYLLNRQMGDYAAYSDSGTETDVRFGQDSGVVTLLKQGGQAIYLEPGRSWPPELLVDRARLTILKAMFIAGLTSGDQLNGFVIVGPPRSGINRYSFEELRFLMNVTAQLSITVERAQVIDSLQQRVRELDVLSQVGQAVNFTIEFDDLLELISAQTAKLIEAPCFYIALRDPTVDQLYFAFFIEGDDRDTAKESQRWPLGRDLFSEVVRTGQAIRVDDYGRAMAQRSVEIVREDPNLKAWMGVPLIAGPRTLGVLAVGKRTPGETFSDEQLKIFSDIGALAATSLDKARLFAEANMRARQLTVLNDISQKLVATESDVEALLQLITTSAVDILNAEAGSLLLTVDDDSQDLEFKVVIGGSASQLIGSRLPAGHGLVGEVAKNGKPVIVNNTQQDPRWRGEVAKGQFHTNSILAVPLTAKEKVIGVLEVVNKRDGTIYVSEDVELLTTFAGQAAIAIENARLFQMTDLQLSKRVQELEVLERIDVELNRTLDLNKVAEITVRWAIANTGATAGALGIVVGAPPVLKMIARYGYKQADFPEGSQGDLWPLDRGIVKRVMRTRQADLATDVSIDPDYIPSLHDGLSQISIPMLSGDDINAILILETNRMPRLNISDWAFAQRLAEHASIAISNAQLYAELTRANESKSEFVSFAAHELKNPLTSVIGFADLVLKGAIGQLNEQQSNVLGIIRSNADRMQTIINDLRDSAKLEANQLSIELAPMDFRHVAVETLRPFQQQLQEKRQEIINKVPEGLPLIMGDQSRLIQVLTNLVSNAHKYSPPESTITIRAEVERRRSPRDHRSYPVLHVSVADTGIGMSEDDVAKLFKERYFRSDNPLAREQPGTGLGMMITQGIVEAHKGEIWVESELNVGTTFHFTIPLAVEAEKKPQVETEAASD